MILSMFNVQPLAFGEQELTDRMWSDQLRVASLVIFPVSILLGHVSLRLTSSWHPSFLRADLWNAAIRILLADVLIEVLQWTLVCVPFEQEDDVTELILQSLGVGCPLYARFLTPHATMYIFLVTRLLPLAVGLFLGEGWMPIALTGGIATGKSTVSAQLVEGYNQEEEDEKKDKEEDKEEEEEDTDDYDPKKKEDDDKEDDDKKKKKDEHLEDGSVFSIDTDKIGHDILLESTAGNVHSRLVKEFGTEILDDEGVISRPLLGSVIFGDDSSKRKLLNKITHPKIIRHMLRRIAWGLFASGKDMCVTDVPLLFESGLLLKSLFCITICVTCTPEQELERLQARNSDLTKEECEARIASQMPLDQKAKLATIVIDNSHDKAALQERVEEVRQELMQRLYGVGLTLFQLVGIMGISLPVAIYYKLQQGGATPQDFSSSS